MKNQDYTTTMLVDKTPQQVFEAINNVRGWWSENVDGSPENLNSEWLYFYKDVHRTMLKTVELVPGKKVVWHVKDNFFNFTRDKTEWKDDHIIFEIRPKDGKTELQFTHQGLVPHYECYDVCNDAWTHYIQDSLRALIETGKGKPTVQDVQDHNAGLIEKWKLEMK